MTWWSRNCSCWCTTATSSCALVRRGQEEGVFRVDLSAEWVVIAVTWLLVGGADGVRLGRLAAREVERRVVETVLSALRRPPKRR
jgi:TetR/AcrR family transcriptional regulator, mexCD-oprJ operon repressor